MERQSNLHSPRVDDELAREVASVTHGAPVESRADDRRAMEDSANGEPVPESVPAELPQEEAGDSSGPGLSRAETRARSALARHLRPSIFPATRDDVVACAIEESAPPDLVGQLRALPDRVYGNVEQVWEALGGQREERATTAQEPAAPEEPDAVGVRRFDFRFDWRYRLAGLPWGVRPESAFVEVDARRGAERFVAHFGPWAIATELSNVIGTCATGPYSTLKTIGPPRLSVRDHGLTLATNARRGLCIRFRRAVPGVEPLGLIRHPAVTVTVDDVDGLAALLEPAERAA